MGENIPGGNFLIEIFRREFTRGKSDWWELFGWEFSIGICIEIVLTTKQELITGIITGSGSIVV